jgi:SAM-dependent methyltransferase
VTAIERWGADLASWAIPEAILANAPESPYGFPAELFRRRAVAARTAPPTPTTERALGALRPGGSVLDVGVGGGATSLPLADLAARIVGVDASEAMLEAFAAAASDAGVKALGVLGSWPTVAPQVESCDVALAGHVLYNVADIEPFVRSMDEHARRRVVLEITDRHPLAWMNDLWLRFHGLVRPERPTSESAVEAIAEVGFDADADGRRVEGTAGGFDRREDAVALVRRRLCLPAERDDELVDALGSRLREVGGLWSAGPAAQAVVTLWWDTSGR